MNHFGMFKKLWLPQTQWSPATGGCRLQPYRLHGLNPISIGSTVYVQPRGPWKSCIPAELAPVIL